MSLRTGRSIANPLIQRVLRHQNMATLFRMPQKVYSNAPVATQYNAPNSFVMGQIVQQRVLQRGAASSEAPQQTNEYSAQTSLQSPTLAIPSNQPQAIAASLDTIGPVASASKGPLLVPDTVQLSAQPVAQNPVQRQAAKAIVPNASTVPIIQPQVARQQVVQQQSTDTETPIRAVQDIPSPLQASDVVNNNASSAPLQTSEAQTGAITTDSTQSSDDLTEDRQWNRLQTIVQSHANRSSGRPQGAQMIQRSPAAQEERHVAMLSNEQLPESLVSSETAVAPNASSRGTAARSHPALQRSLDVVQRQTDQAASGEMNTNMQQGSETSLVSQSAESQPQRLDSTTTLPENEHSLHQDITQSGDNPDEDRQWNRLQAIVQAHGHKSMGGPQGRQTIQRLPASAEESNVVVSPREQSSEAVQRQAGEAALGEINATTRQGGGALQSAKGRLPLTDSSAIPPQNEQRIRPKQMVADNTVVGNEPPIETRPLEEVWPVQYQKHATTTDVPDLTSESRNTVQAASTGDRELPITTNRLSGNQEQSISSLQAIQQSQALDAAYTMLETAQTAQPTESTVHVVAPRRPRPIRQLHVQRTATTENIDLANTSTSDEGLNSIDELTHRIQRQANSAQAGQPSVEQPVTDRKEPVAGIPTDIGDLPADLWSLIGEDLPQEKGETAKSSSLHQSSPELDAHTISESPTGSSATVAAHSNPTEMSIQTQPIHSGQVEGSVSDITKESGTGTTAQAASQNRTFQKSQTLAIPEVGLQLKPEPPSQVGLASGQPSDVTTLVPDREEAVEQAVMPKLPAGSSSSANVEFGSSSRLSGESEWDKGDSIPTQNSTPDAGTRRIAMNQPTSNLATVLDAPGMEAHSQGPLSATSKPRVQRTPLTRMPLVPAMPVNRHLPRTETGSQRATQGEHLAAAQIQNVMREMDPLADIGSDLTSAELYGTKPIEEEPAEKEQESGDNFDVAELARQVYIQLRRRLAIEWERMR